MNPQGSLPFNAETFDRLADQINAVQSCAELQGLTDEAMQSANALLPASARRWRRYSR